MSDLKSLIILAICCLTFATAFPKPNGSQLVGEVKEGAIRVLNDATLKDQWTFGNCGTYVRSQDLVYYDHVKIQANSAGSSLSDTVSWVGTKKVYCVELIGNQGTQLKIQNGGVGYTSVTVYGVSGVGKDLEGIVYVYAS